MHTYNLELNLQFDYQVGRPHLSQQYTKRIQHAKMQSKETL